MFIATLHSTLLLNVFTFSSIKTSSSFTGYFEPFLQSLYRLPYNHFHLPTQDQNGTLGKPLSTEVAN